MADDGRCREVVEAYARAVESADFDALEDLFGDDFLADWPQSGERVRSKAACLAIFRGQPAGPPRYEVRAIRGSGHLWVVEATAWYGEERFEVSSILECRDGRIIRETDYFAPPFEPPAWRMQWVEVG
ncbi:MAG TPA: nuclear transport factor 2 family protein [Candidatus Limnocylindrales bacterium]|nr:nuclear transport factor 2 family protein [Candidatus Limnocylindrales bacterium]